jgi:hypothetical protein
MCFGSKSRTEDDTSIDWKHHAYLDIVRYLQFFAALNLAFGIWGTVESDSLAIAHLDPPTQHVCQRVNNFMKVLSIGCFVESGITLFLALSIFSVPAGGWWALSTVISFGLFCLHFVAKAIALFISIIWIWGEDTNICESAIAPLYRESSKYLFGLLVVFGFQLFIGTAFLFGCGLGKAVDEGWTKCMNPPQSPMDLSDDEDDMEEQRELLPGGGERGRGRKGTKNQIEGELSEGEGAEEVTSDQEEGNPGTAIMLSPADMESPITVNYFGTTQRET